MLCHDPTDLEASLQRTGEGVVLFGVPELQLLQRRLLAKVPAKNAIEWHVNEREVTLLISAVTVSSRSCPAQSMQVASPPAPQREDPWRRRASMDGLHRRRDNTPLPPKYLH